MLAVKDLTGNRNSNMLPFVADLPAPQGLEQEITEKTESAEFFTSRGPRFQEKVSQQV